MRVESDAVIKFPLDVVFRTYRDHLPDFVVHLPNVRSIRVDERVEEGDVVRLVNVWEGGGEIPKAVRPMLSEDMLSWHDYATWRKSERVCEWMIRTHAFEDAVRCSGANRFVAIDGGRTRLEIRGELNIDLSKIRGVPSFLAGSLACTVEQFLVRQITANLLSVAEGLSTYLERHTA